MLSRVMQRSALAAVARRSAPVMGKAYPTDRANVCFCGCDDVNHMRCTGMIKTQQRNFQKHLNLDSTQNLLPAEYQAKDQVALW